VSYHLEVIRNRLNIKRSENGKGIAQNVCNRFNQEYIVPVSHLLTWNETIATTVLTTARSWFGNDEEFRAWAWPLDSKGRNPLQFMKDKNRANDSIERVGALFTSHVIKVELPEGWNWNVNVNSGALLPPVRLHVCERGLSMTIYKVFTCLCWDSTTEVLEHTGCCKNES